MGMIFTKLSGSNESVNHLFCLPKQSISKGFFSCFYTAKVGENIEIGIIYENLKQRVISHLFACLSNSSMF